MQEESIILFKGSDNIVRWGKVIHYKNWYEDWNCGRSSQKIFDVLLDDKEYYLQDGDISDLIDKGKEEFKQKTGFEWGSDFL